MVLLSCFVNVLQWVVIFPFLIIWWFNVLKLLFSCFPLYKCKDSSTQRDDETHSKLAWSAACWFSCNAFDLELAHVFLGLCAAEEAGCACTFPCRCTLSVQQLRLIVQFWFFYVLCIVSACLFLKFSDRDSWYSGKFSRDLSDLLSYVLC